MKPHEKADIQYPRHWPYTVIGTDAELMKITIKSMFEGRDIVVKESKKSKKGNFVSLNITLHVLDEESRNHAFNQFKTVPTVKVVM
jgi:putative lipoic acid-binding regulatory protein